MATHATKTPGSVAARVSLLEEDLEVLREKDGPISRIIALERELAVLMAPREDADQMHRFGP